MSKNTLHYTSEAEGIAFQFGIIY